MKTYCKSDKYRCILYSCNRLGLYAEIKIMFGAVHMWVYIYNIFVINKGTDTSKKPKTTGSWAKTNLREGGGEGLQQN